MIEGRDEDMESFIIDGKECPECKKNSFFPWKSVPDSLDIMFKCSGCGHTERIEGKEE